MQDNRPKVHRNKNTAPQPKAPEPELNAIPPKPEEEPVVKAKAVRAQPMGMLGGLGNLLGGLTGGLGGGGIGTVLPVVLLVSTLSRGRGVQPRPVAKAQAIPAIPVEPVAAETAEVHIPAKKHETEKKTRKKPDEKPSVQAAAPLAPESIPQPAPAPQPRPQPRPGPKPHEIRNLLNDLSGYLPGNGNASVAKVARIMGLADELKSLNSPGSVFVASTPPADPLSKHIGLLNVLGKNMPGSGSSNLNKAGQVLSIVSTLRGDGGGGLGALGNLGGLGNIGGMLRGAMSQPQQSQTPEMKNITPQQADGIKDTVNRLLSGMDDKQKSDLLDKAKDFLGKK